MRKTMVIAVLLFVNLGVGLVTPHSTTLPVLLAIAVPGAGIVAAIVRSKRHA